MLHKVVRNPWRVGDSDSEDEVQNQFDVHAPLPSRLATPSTPNVAGRRNELKVPDWHPITDEDTHSGKSGHRRTAPSYERAPSDHKPIFSGPLSLKSSSNSVLVQDKTIGFNAPETPPATPPIIDSNFNPYVLLQEDSNKFIHINIPKDYPSFIRCCLRRDKATFQKGFFPRFYFFAERPGDGKKFVLLVARKLAKVKRQSEYIISTNIETLSEKEAGEGFVGRLRENNFMGTEYTLYDNGISPNKYKTTRSNAKNGLRCELASIIYNTNIFGLSGPRQINAVIPKPGHEIQPTKHEDTILDQCHDKQFSNLIQLRNRLPEYNKEKKLHTLQFTGNRAVEPSVKNFQIMIDTENDEVEEIAMQFGRIDKDTFACDYRYPFSALQAFGIALSSFDSRFTRE